MTFRQLRARLDALAARAPVPRSALHEVEFDLVEDRDGQPTVTGTLVRAGDTWREIRPAEGAL